MDNDTAIVLLLADMQRQIESLRSENSALKTHLEKSQGDGSAAKE